MLQAEISAVTSLHWNLTAKSYLVKQLWVWQARAGGCRGRVDPLPISPPPPTPPMEFTFSLSLPRLSIQTHNLVLLSLSLPAFLSVWSNKYAGVLFITSILRPKTKSAFRQIVPALCCINSTAGSYYGLWFSSKIVPLSTWQSPSFRLNLLLYNLSFHVGSPQQ